MIHDYIIHGRDAAIADIRNWMNKEWPSDLALNPPTVSRITLGHRRNKKRLEKTIQRTWQYLKWRSVAKDKWNIEPKLMVNAVKIIFEEIEEAIKAGKSVTIPNFGVFRLHISEPDGIPSLSFTMDPRWRNAINEPVSETDLGFFRRVSENGRIEKLT